MFKINNGADVTTVAAQYRSLIEELTDAVLERHTRRDFSTVFEKYIHE
ncbi:YvbH-like oligomerization domain-containing protein [Gemmatimonas sp.]